MKPEQWPHIRDLFDRAADLPDAELQEFLESETSDPQVRAEVLRLARFDRAQGDFLNHPVAHLLPKPATVRPGDLLLQRFRLVRLIDTGGMGQVFEAEDLESHTQRIALKTLDPSYYESVLLRDQFRHELLLARRISHPNICRVYELHHAPEQGLLFLTMEYLEGENLGARMRRAGALPESAVRRFARQVAGALAAAHRQDVLHCDLKPSNVILTPRSEGDVAVVTDFGLARPAAMAARFVIPHGTPAYMAPELRSGTTPATHASDIYSFGVLLYEMLTGELPPAPPGRMKDMGKWHPVLERCLAPRPTDRPPTGEALLQLLQERKPHRRTLILAAGTLLLGGAGFLARSFWPGERITTLAVLPFQSGPEELEASLAASLPIAAAIELSRLRGIRAIGSTSIKRVQGSGKSLSQIAAELGVQTLVTGSVHTENGFFVVKLKITDGPTGELKWSRQLRRPLAESPSIRKDIVVALATALPVPFNPTVFDSARPTTVPEAFAAHAMGAKLANERTLGGRVAAMAHFRRAVQLDPRYTRSRTALANVLTGVAGSPGFPYVESLEQAEREVQISLAEDPNLGETHWVYGSILQALHWDWENAERHFRRSIELNPGFAHGHQRLAALLSNLGRAAEAILEIRLVVQIEPLSATVHSAYASYLLRAGEAEEAMREIRFVEALSPRHPEIPLLHAQRSALAGEWGAAAHSLEDAISQDPDKHWLRGALALALFRSGRHAQARELRKSLERAEGIPPTALVYAYAGEGRTADAVRKLHEARARHDPGIATVAVEPLLQGLEKEPGFQAFIKEMRLR